MIFYVSDTLALLFDLDCKTLAPIWETLADDFATESDVVIAKVDAEAENSKSVTKEQGITGYPTIKYFPKGSSEPEAYGGARTEQAFIEFLNSKTGSHRAVGGGLDEFAGTIPEINAIIAKYTSSHELEKLIAEVNKAVKDVSDKYAQYYAKVAEKLGQSQDYASKELARLEKILLKGSSAREKVDDIISRSNILRQFVGRAKDEKKDEL